MATCPTQPVTFWDVVPQHQGCESLVLFTFSTHSIGCLEQGSYPSNPPVVWP